MFEHLFAHYVKDILCCSSLVGNSWIIYFYNSFFVKGEREIAIIVNWKLKGICLTIMGKEGMSIVIDKNIRICLFVVRGEWILFQFWNMLSHSSCESKGLCLYIYTGPIWNTLNMMDLYGVNLKSKEFFITLLLMQ